MTDQRNRVTTDPGLGPVEPEHRSTLRSMVAADRIEPEDEHPGAPVYYEPKPLNAVSDHKTLELETVKLSKDIDPRKLPTQLKLRRPVLHVVPASDPNWPAPSPLLPPQFDSGWPPPEFDSGWPPPETVLTTSQPPLAARRRSFVPLVLLGLLSATLLLLLGATARRRSAASSQAARAATPTIAAAPKKTGVLPSTRPMLGSRESTSDVRASAPPTEASARRPPAGASTSAPSIGAATNADSSATAADPAASAAPVPLTVAPRHTNFKPIAPSPMSAQSPTPSAPPTTKPKRAIY